MATATVRDHVYDLVSVLYHALSEQSSAKQYRADAREAGDERLAAFFGEVADQAGERAARARSLMREHLGAAADDAFEEQLVGHRRPHLDEDADAVDEASWESFPASDAPAW